MTEKISLGLDTHPLSDEMRTDPQLDHCVCWNPQAVFKKVFNWARAIAQLQGLLSADPGGTLAQSRLSHVVPQAKSDFWEHC